MSTWEKRAREIINEVPNNYRYAPMTLANRLRAEWERELAHQEPVWWMNESGKLSVPAQSKTMRPNEYAHFTVPLFTRPAATQPARLEKEFADIQTEIKHAAQPVPQGMAEPTLEQWQDFYDRVWDLDEDNPTLSLPKEELQRIGRAMLAASKETP